MKAIVGQSVIAGSAPDGARRRARCRGYQGIITKIDGEFITVRFGARVTRQYHESNLSFLKPNNLGACMTGREKCEQMRAEKASRRMERVESADGRGQYSLEQTGAASPEPLGPRIDRIMDDLLDIEYHSGCSARVEDMVHRAISFLESARIAVVHER